MHLLKLKDNTYLATDKDGAKWICKKKPFDNGFGRWFVKLEINEDYSDVMVKVK